jgi:hypothetical protein
MAWSTIIKWWIIIMILIKNLTKGIKIIDEKKGEPDKALLLYQLFLMS